MKTLYRSVQLASLAALALAGLGCAHVAATPATAAAPDAARAPARLVITGSRLPQPVNAQNGLPDTISPVRIYTRDQLLGTGQPGLGAALQSLDPSAR